jgi:hypothetical protein
MRTDFFRATPRDLRRALPAWRTPLEHPVRTRVVNPFTRLVQDVWTWDPTPDVEVPPYASDDPPGPSIEMEGFENLAVPALLDVLLPTEASALRLRLFPQGGDERRPAMVGPTDGPWIWEVPSPVVKRLAELTTAQIDEVGPRWATSLRAEQMDLLDDAFYTDGLRRLAAFAREAVASGQALYEWVAGE